MDHRHRQMLGDIFLSPRIDAYNYVVYPPYMSISPPLCAVETTANYYCKERKYGVLQGTLTPVCSTQGVIFTCKKSAPVFCLYHYLPFGILQQFLIIYRSGLD